MITLIVTLLPKSDKLCKIAPTIMNYISGHCYDKIFSGHTLFTILAVLIMSEFKIIKPQNINMMWLLQIIYAILIILSKNHYTIDVLLAYLIVIPIFHHIKNYDIFN